MVRKDSETFRLLFFTEYPTDMYELLLSKSVGTQYEIVCDRKNHLVTIFQKGKKIAEYHFDKLCNAINFYARLKTNKAVKDADKIVTDYQQ